MRLRCNIKSTCLHECTTDVLLERSPRANNTGYVKRTDKRKPFVGVSFVFVCYRKFFIRKGVRLAINEFLFRAMPGCPGMYIYL